MKTKPRDENHLNKMSSFDWNTFHTARTMHNPYNVQYCGTYVVTKTIANTVESSTRTTHSRSTQYAILIYGSFSIKWHKNLHLIHILCVTTHNDSFRAIIFASMVLARQSNDELLIPFDLFKTISRKIKKQIEFQIERLHSLHRDWTIFASREINELLTQLLWTKSNFYQTSIANANVNVCQ